MSPASSGRPVPKPRKARKSGSPVQEKEATTTTTTTTTTTAAAAAATTTGVVLNGFANGSVAHPAEDTEDVRDLEMKGSPDPQHGGEGSGSDGDGGGGGERGVNSRNDSVEAHGSNLKNQLLQNGHLEETSTNCDTDITRRTSEGSIGIRRKGGGGGRGGGGGGEREDVW